MRRNILSLLVLTLAIVLPAAPASAQRSIEITGDRLSGSVLPVEPLEGEITIRALHGWAWTVDDTKRLVLEGDVEIADSAVLWLNRMPSEDGLINQIAMYFDRLENPSRRAGLGVAGESLLVTGSTRGDVVLRVAVLDQERPRRTPELRRAEDRLALYLRRLLVQSPRLENRPQVDEPPSPEEFEPIPGGRVEPEELTLPTELELPPPGGRRPWLRDPGSVIMFTAGRTEIIPGEDENVITATGSIIVEYYADRRDLELSQLTLSAERAVIFTDPGTLEEMAAWEIDASRVRGIYLEGNVTASANEGQYIVRSPRIFYDFTTGRAIMLDAVLRTYARDSRLPVYARAREMRQIAENQWDAKSVQVSTSEFYIGHLSLGANRMTLTQRPGRGGSGEEMHIDARDITLRAGRTPFFYWPRFSGTIEDIPLRSVEVGTGNNVGLGIETNWNAFALLGVEPPGGVNADLSIDGFTERGGAIGLKLDYSLEPGIGVLDLYGMYDDGVDRTSSGREVEQDGELRGVALWEHQMRLARHWSLQLQTSYISDPTFITTWREDDFRERREYETSAYAKYQNDRLALTAMTRYELNDFISNSYLLASTQYQVDTLPEFTLRDYGESWFGDTVTYSGETRASRMRLVFDRSTPRELGVPERAFGIGPDDRLSDALRAEGYESDYVMRFDTRHELRRPMRVGIFNVTPYIVGRLTAYDDDFDEFSSDSDNIRIFGSAGLTVNTQFQRVDNSVESRLFDLHRVRHIIEPSVTVWYAYADVTQEHLPIYDVEVESLATGAAMRVGLRNTWQTQRGGPGRWRSVDFLTLDADLVLNSSDAERESPASQFFEYRPEYSQFGDHVHSSVLWVLSDTLSLAGEGIFDLDDSAIARGSVGAELRHSPTFVTYVEFRYLDASDNELLDIGWRYILTPKYRVSLSPQWDFREDDFRSLRVAVTRRFPDFDFTVRVNYDRIRDDTTVGASLGLAEF
jgi:hypothetical protein